MDVYAASDADPGDLALMLLGPVSGLVLGRLGFPCLHASAVDTGDGAIVFLGPPGHGKTTMAAALLHRGAPLLPDDVLPLWPRADGVFGRPGAPVMKLWASTASGSLGVGHGLPRLSATLEKMWLTLDESRPYAVSEQALPLRALYVLQRYDPPADAGPEPAIEEIPLGARDALAVLLAQTYRGEFLRPQEAAALLPIYSRLVAQAPVRLLRYPNGFGHQDRLCARLLGAGRHDSSGTDTPTDEGTPA